MNSLLNKKKNDTPIAIFNAKKINSMTKGK
jgi:hypothetical protein